MSPKSLIHSFITEVEPESPVGMAVPLFGLSSSREPTLDEKKQAAFQQVCIVNVLIYAQSIH